MDNSPIYKGIDLENWRIKNNLKIFEACEAFGLSHQKWLNLTSKKKDELIEDKVISYLLKLFEKYPESNPIQNEFNIKEVYYLLGFKDKPADRKEFANLVGRSVYSSYRFTTENNASKTVTKWIEAVKRVDQNPKKMLFIMRDIVNSFSEEKIF